MSQHGCLTAVSVPPTLTGMTRLILALTLLLVMAWPAWADWAMTRWGMSPDEVSEATDGVVASVSFSASRVSVGTVAAMEMTYEKGEVPYDVSLLFGERGLNRVYLSPQADPNTICFVLLPQLVEELGVPASSAPGSCLVGSCEYRSHLWIDSERNNIVSFATMQEDALVTWCQITYRWPY